MSNPTPGPWRAERRNWRGEQDPHRFYVSGNAHEDPNEDGDGPITLSTAVAIVEGNATSHEVTAANARLIAASPIGYELAMMILEADRHGPTISDEIVQKARKFMDTAERRE